MIYCPPAARPLRKPHHRVDRLSCQIVIVGGGIAGLWLLRRCLAAGLDAHLIEARALGSDQTIAAQGIIHGGIKYTLAGTLTRASEAIATMPARWRAALAGTDHVDLSGLQPRSEHFYMWSRGTLRDRVAGLFAGKALRGRVERLRPPEYPAFFRHPAFDGQVWSLEDFVLDVPALIERLSRGVASRIHLDRPRRAVVDGRTLQALETASGRRWQAQRYLFCAGAGNESLLTLIGADAPAMQRRPLEQVVLSIDWPDPLFAHCISELTRPEPRLTVTTHNGANGESVWYVGGAVATRDTGSAAERIRQVARELETQLPWVDLGSARFWTVAADRAEARQSGTLRPDEAFAAAAGGVDNVLVGWPTKLTLAPDLGDKAMAWLAASGVTADQAPTARGDADLEGTGVGIAATHWSDPGRTTDTH